MMRYCVSLIFSFLVFAVPMAGFAHARSADPVTAQEPVTELEEVIATARRAEAPIWEITRGDNRLILFGSIAGVPGAEDWRPDALEAAVARADRIILPQVARLSFGDVGRVIWRARSIVVMPEDKTSADYLPPEMQQRLERVMADARNDRWHRKSFLILSSDLLTDHAGFSARRSRSAEEVVKAVAKRLDKSTREVGAVAGRDLVESLIAQPPETHLPCMASAIAAAEAGPQVNIRRVADWRARRVVAVMDNSLTQALNLCWPWGNPDLAPVLKQQWTEAIQWALGQDGTTLAVAQLNVLAETGGVLDQLQAAGYAIEGPDWKPVPK